MATAVREYRRLRNLALEVSTAVADISPSHAVGNGRTAKNVKVESHGKTLEANIVTFLDQCGDPVSLIGLDSMLSSEKMERFLEDLLCDKTHRVLIVASHTHHSPVLSPRFAANYDYDVEIVEQTAQKIAQAIKRNLTSCRHIDQVRVGKSAVAGNVYRRKMTLSIRFKPLIVISQEYAMAADHDEPIPKDLHVYVAENVDGRAEFVIWSWTCHATSVSQTRCFSADYPGVVREHLRKVLGDESLSVIYLPGFCGDIRPDSSSFFTFNRARVRHPVARLFKKKGRNFFDELCDRLVKGVDNSLRVSTTERSNGAVSCRRISVPVSTFFTGTGPQEMGISRVNLPGLELLLVGAEVSYGFQEILEAERGGVFSGDVLYSGLYGEVFGYFPTEKQVIEGGYEPKRSQATYSIAGIFHPELNQRFIEMVSRLYD